MGANAQNSVNVIAVFLGFCIFINFTGMVPMVNIVCYKSDSLLNKRRNLDKRIIQHITTTDLNQQ